MSRWKALICMRQLCLLGEHTPPKDVWLFTGVASRYNCGEHITLLCFRDGEDARCDKVQLQQEKYTDIGLIVL